YISSTVLEEIDAAEKEIKERLLSLVKDYEMKILILNEEVEMLAMEYISERIIPEKYTEDAYHIAFSVVNNLDILVSWNFDHIVKLKTKKMVNGISYLRGLKVIEICTPWEVEYEF
ncbi:MAG: PIN domain nuclease, partial [Elusimicrobiota bacterium]|nr:PIN domain nuclease [Elusimicrobiota bacterium]